MMSQVMADCIYFCGRSSDYVVVFLLLFYFWSARVLHWLVLARPSQLIVNLAVYFFKKSGLSKMEALLTCISQQWF